MLTAVLGLLVAVMLAPMAFGAGGIAVAAADRIAAAPVTSLDGSIPLRSTITDDAGQVIAYIYQQDRASIPLSEVSPYLPQAMIAMEDRHFYADDGVDWTGMLRAAVSDLAGHPLSGGSSIAQQLVKNYEYLTNAGDPGAQQAATADTLARKIDQTKSALAYAATHTKDQILDYYLNLVAFGPSTYGAQAAAQRFFSEPAAKLSLAQSALLAGMVNNPNLYDPLNPADLSLALARRNLVLDAMARNGDITTEQAAQTGREPAELKPSTIGDGCVDAPDSAVNGYFCEYVLQYLQQAGISYAELQTGGLTITTTMDPAAMAAARHAATGAVSGTASATRRIANVMAILQPGQSNRKVLALVANRPFGPDSSAGQSEEPLPTALAPLGAGSIFKLFTTAAAMRAGLVTPDTVLDVPPTLVSTLTPGHTFHNAENYPPRLTLAQALASSPNTPFVALEDQVGLPAVTGMAVALGLRSYRQPAGSIDPAMAGSSLDYAQAVAAQRISSFTLGVSPVSPLELANVGATLDSGGVWCPPDPIASITGPTGAPVGWHRQACDRAVPAGLADTLTNALSGDMRDPDGTSYAAARAAGWTRPSASKTGTTQDYSSSAFLGFTPAYSGAVLTWDYLPHARSICLDPVRSCSTADAQAGEGMVGGSVPAETWLAAMTPLDATVPAGAFPPSDPAYLQAESSA